MHPTAYDPRRHPGPCRRSAPGDAAALLLIAILACAGCAVGPRFTRPAPPNATSYTAPGDSLMTGAGRGDSLSAAPAESTAVQRLAAAEQIPADWWTLFRSPALDGMVRAAIANNRTVAAARATLAAALEDVTAAQGAFFPQIDFGADAERRRGSFGTGRATLPLVTSGSQVTNLYSLGPTVSYSLDVFGATRRTVEQRRAQADFQRYELAAAWLALTGNVATQAFTVASVREEIRATEEVIADDERLLDFVRRELAAGKVARTDELTAETQLAGDRANLPPLYAQLGSARDALAVLTGRPPAEWTPPDLDLKDFTLPGDLPLTLPSALARQRPDILAAEAQLHASNAAIGIATAQLFPSFTLSGSAVQESSDTSSLFQSANRFWTVIGSVNIPIFHGGALLAQRRAAVLTHRASLATYEQTVLQGLQQVADVLHAIAQDRELVGAEQALVATAATALDLQRRAYEAGKSDILQVTTAEQTYQRARVSLARAQAQRLQDTAQLLVALGGGWSQAEMAP